MNRKNWLRKLFLEGKIMFTQETMNLKTFLGTLLVIYLFFIYLCLYVFVFHVDKLHVSKQFLFMYKIGFFSIFYLFVFEWFATYSSIDNEGIIAIHYQVIERYISEKIKAKYLLSLFHSLIHFILLTILAIVIEITENIFAFIFLLLPMIVMGGVSSVFSSMVFPRFDWLEITDIPTKKNYAAMGMIYCLWLSMATGISSQVVHSKSFYFFIFLYWFLTIIVIVLLVRVSPIVLKEKLFLTLRTDEEGKNVKN
ncbi:MAG: hypothetical protein LBS28_05000 [Streptococcaceae bacterium]|nr:hypothetical protein [Streptococcaceae bacterium]